MAFEELNFGPYRIRCDPEATRVAYTKSPKFTCECPYCKNFIAAWPIIYADEVGNFYKMLGIATCHEDELSQFQSLKNGSQAHSGWAYTVGELITPPFGCVNHLVTSPEDSRQFNVSFSSNFHRAGEPFMDLPTLKMDFSIIVPWVLKDAPPEADSE